MTATSAQSKPNAELSQKAATFLEARGLDVELALRLGLTSRAGRDGADWLVIPYERNGVKVNEKARRIDQKQWFQTKGGEQVFWRLDAISDPGLTNYPLLITEGEFDALAAIQAGHWRTVSVPSGAPSSAQGEDARSSAKYSFLEASRDALEPIREIIIAADADGPGAALLNDLTSMLGPARCKFVSYHDDCKDLNDVLLKHGEDAVRACINGARWVRVAGVYKLSDLPPLPPLMVWRPQLLDCIDKLIPICPGHVSVWTGIAGHGKSTLLNAVMWSISDTHNVRIAHGTFEATPQREYLKAAIAFHAGDPIGSREHTPEAIKEGRQWVEDHIIFLNADGYAGPQNEEWIDATLDWFLQAAQTAVVRHGCRIVILDPWSQLDHEPDRNEREDLYIRRALKRFKMFARSFDCHVAIVAHPAKPKRDPSTGSYQMPEGYDISGSAHWYNAADVGVTVHRSPEMIEGDDDEFIPDPRSQRVLIRVWKIKVHSEMGKPGDAYANVDFRTGRYMSASSWE
jgi:twinkle protein